MTKNLLSILATTKNDYLLKEITSDLEDFDCKGLYEMLDYSYKSKDPNIIRSATFLNSAFTHRSLVFLMTKRSFGNLVDTDELNPNKDCNGTSFKTMISVFIKRGFIKQLRKGKTGKAGLYEIIHPDLIDYMKEIYLRDVTEAYENAMNFDKVYADKRQAALDYWEGENNIEETPKRTKEEIRASINAAQKKLIEERNGKNSTNS